MAYFVVDKFGDGTEWAFEMRPVRMANGRCTAEPHTNFVELPKGSIKRLTGQDLTFEDEAIFYWISLPTIEHCFSFKELFVMFLKKIFKID
jgi:hypothetical protein